MTLAPLAAAFGAAAAVVAVLVVSRHQTVAVSANVFVNPPGLIDASNSPTVVRDPHRPDSLVVVRRVDRPRFSAGLDWSNDGGAHWNHTALPLPAGDDRPYAPDAAFAPDGTLYVTYVNLEGAGNTPANLWVAKSTDDGASLSAPVRATGRLAFQPRLAVGGTGAVYLTWMQASEVGLLKLGPGPHPVVLARSTDGGQTFSAPSQVSDPGRPRVGAASPVVDRQGNVLVLYEDFKGDVRDFENLEGPPWDQPFALVLSRSTDGGRSFPAGTEVDAGLLATHRFLVFLPEYPSLAVGTRGRLYVAWSDGRNGDEDVFLRRSDDDGRTWSGPIRVNNDRLHDGTDQSLPRVAVGDNGQVSLVFLDRRRDPTNVMSDAELATSSDGGRSYRNIRVSSASFGSGVGPVTGPPFPVDFGSRLGLVAGHGAVVAAWTDSRLGTAATGRQDVVAATVRLPPPTRGLARWPTALVLLALGVASLAGWVLTAHEAT